MATCPVCEDFTGPARSVEAHISGLTDEAHRGKVGRNHRERIKATVGDDGRAGRPELEESEVADPPTPDRPPTTQIEGEGKGDVSATWGLLGGTVVLALMVLATTSTSGGGSSPDGSDGSETSVSSSMVDDPENGLAQRYE
jgi:hypothetical protein